MAVTQAYTHSTLAVTSLNNLAGNGWASSAEFDNSSGTYQEVQVGGIVVGGSSHVAGDVVRLYVRARYGNAATETTGAIGSGGDDIANETEAEGTVFSKENLIPIGEVHFDGVSSTQHWGPFSISEAFGGHMPDYFGVMYHNVDTGATMGASGHTLETKAIQYTSA